MRIFPKREARLRLVTALSAEQPVEGVSSDALYRRIGELRRWHQEQRQEEVALTAVQPTIGGGALVQKIPDLIYNNQSDAGQHVA